MNKKENDSKKIAESAGRSGAAEITGETLIKRGARVEQRGIESTLRTSKGQSTKQMAIDLTKKGRFLKNTGIFATKALNRSIVFGDIVYSATIGKEGYLKAAISSLAGYGLGIRAGMLITAGAGTLAAAGIVIPAFAITTVAIVGGATVGYFSNKGADIAFDEISKLAKNIFKDVTKQGEVKPSAQHPSQQNIEWKTGSERGEDSKDVLRGEVTKYVDLSKNPDIWTTESNSLKAIEARQRSRGQNGGVSFRDQKRTKPQVKESYLQKKSADVTKKPTKHAESVARRFRTPHDFSRIETKMREKKLDSLKSPSVPGIRTSNNKAYQIQMANVNNQAVVEYAVSRQYVPSRKVSHYPEEEYSWGWGFGGDSGWSWGSGSSGGSGASLQGIMYDSDGNVDATVGYHTGGTVVPGSGDVLTLMQGGERVRTQAQEEELQRQLEKQEIPFIIKETEEDRKNRRSIKDESLNERFSSKDERYIINLVADAYRRNRYGLRKALR